MIAELRRGEWPRAPSQRRPPLVRGCGGGGPARAAEAVPRQQLRISGGGPAPAAAAAGTPSQSGGNVDSGKTFLSDVGSLPNLVGSRASDTEVCVRNFIAIDHGIAELSTPKWSRTLLYRASPVPGETRRSRAAAASTPVHTRGYFESGESFSPAIGSPPNLVATLSMGRVACVWNFTMIRRARAV